MIAASLSEVHVIGLRLVELFPEVIELLPEVLEGNIDLGLRVPQPS